MHTALYNTYSLSYSSWYPDTVFITTQLLLTIDGMAHLHNATGSPHDAGSICPVELL